MTWRRTRSRSRTNTQGLEERGEEKQKRGVNGRDIVVLDNSGRRLGSTSEPPIEEKSASDPESSSTSSETRDVNPHGGVQFSQQTNQLPHVARNITFADDVIPSVPGAPEDDRVPQMPSTEQNIAFLERQRNQNSGEILRIPGPRESDRGQGPETLRDDPNTPLSPDGEGQDRHITFPNLEPTRTRTTNMAGSLLPRTTTGRSQGASSALERSTSAYRVRRSSGTFPFQRSTTTQTSPAPYLSWQPTIGRNSAFVDLTEEQREELGGIEYRSLKLLALILIGKTPSSNKTHKAAKHLTVYQAIMWGGTLWASSISFLGY